MSRRGLGPTVAVILITVAATGGAAAAENLLPNADLSDLDAVGQPVGWTVTAFHGTPAPRLSVEALPDEAGRAMVLTFTQTARACSSLHLGPLSLDTDRTARLSFRYRFEGEVTPDRSASWALSAAEGCVPPLYRQGLELAPAGEWRQESHEFPLTGTVEGHHVLEFVLENTSVDRSFAAGERFLVADLRLEYAGEPLPLRITLDRPPSGVVYTDQPVPRLRGLLLVPRRLRGLPAQVELRTGDPQEALLRSVSLPAAGAREPWELELEKVPPGRYRLVAQVNSPQPDSGAAAGRVVTVIPPDPRLARVRNNTIYRGDKPFLPLGLYHVHDWTLAAVNAESRRIGAPEITREQMLRGIAEQGFNCILYHATVEEDFVQDAARHGLLVVPTASPRGEKGAELREILQPWDGDARVLGWYGRDEPQPGPGMTEAQELYRTSREVCPHPPVITALNHPAPLDLLTPGEVPADVLAMDIYDLRAPDSDLSGVGAAVRRAAEFVQGNPDLVVGVVPQAFIWWGPEPTVAQLRAQLYMGVVNGARAFILYSYVEDYGAEPFTRMREWTQVASHVPEGMSGNPLRQRWWLPDSDMWPALPDLLAELRSLEPFILNDGEPLEVRADSGPVQWAAKRVEQGAWLIAVNPTAQPQTLTVRFPQPVRLRGEFGTPTPERAARRFGLPFEGYEAQVWRIE